MKAFLVRLFFIISITISVSSGLARAEDTTWESMGFQDGVAMFRKEVPGSSVVAFRGEGMIDAPLSKVASVVMDCDRTKEWVHQLVQCTIVKKLNTYEFIVQNHLGMPAFLTDRDFVSHTKITVDPQKKFIYVVMDSIDVPEAPVKDFVRGQLHGEWKIESRENGTKTFVSAEMHGDPKGSVPKWLVNLFQKAWPTNTFGGLRKQVLKADLKMIPKIAEILGVTVSPSTGSSPAPGL